MFLMKIFLIILIIFAFALIGFIFYLNYNSKKKLYKSLIGFCNYSLLEIRFNKSNFLKIIEKYMKSCCLEAKNFLKSYIDKNSYTSKILQKEENYEIQNFILSLGKKDIDGEVSNLKNFKSLFEIKLKKAEDDEKKKGVPSLKVFIILGLIIAIILV